VTFIQNYIAEQSVAWKRQVFFKFVEVFCGNTDKSVAAPSTSAPYSIRLIADMLKIIIIPMIEKCFEKNEQVEFIGCTPEPDFDNDKNIISLFINKIIDSENSYTMADSIRIHLLQLSSIFVIKAHNYIHDVNNKKQGTKLRRLMTFAWPSLLAKTCVDPINKYNGLLLLSHIISKFAIHKRIVLQVFHSLLKAYSPEAKSLVREALDILTPSFTTRTEEGYITLSTWIKKLLIEENHSVPQIAHICYIIVKFENVFFCIRHSLINQLIISIQKISLSANSTIENRTIALDLAEILMLWEAKRVQSENSQMQVDNSGKNGDVARPYEKHVGDFILNFFLRMSLIDSASNNPTMSSNTSQSTHSQQNDNLTIRSLKLFKMGVASNLFPNCDIKMDIIEKILVSTESSNAANPLANVLGPLANPNPQHHAQSNQQSICNCLEIITCLIDYSQAKPKIQQIIRSVHKGLSYALISNNSRTVRSVSQLIEKLMLVLPNECFNNSPAQTLPGQPLETAVATSPTNDPIYTLFGQPEGILCRAIIESLSFFDKSTLMPSDQSNSSLATNSTLLNQQIEILSNCLVLLKAASTNNQQYIDRIMVPFMKILQKLYRDHLNSSSQIVLNSNQPQLAGFLSAEGSNFIQMSSGTTASVNTYSELLIQSIDLIKFRIGVMSLEMRKVFINTILVSLIEKSIDQRVIKYLIKLICDWVKYNTSNTSTAATAANSSNVLINQIPSIKEKLILLQRLSLCVEKRFGENAELNKAFLETILHVYRNDAYATNIEFKIKLEPAFLMGLRSSNAELRQSFFELFDKNFNSNELYERLCYIIVTQNWECFGAHYWIKQCIQMTLSSCESSTYKLELFNFLQRPIKFGISTAASSPSGIVLSRLEDSIDTFLNEFSGNFRLILL
jgi:transformation/transcription domain-associated protein